MVGRITRTSLPGTEPKKAQKSRKRTRGNRAIDAYAIAEQQIAEKPKFAKHRLGALESGDDERNDGRGFKRRRNEGYPNKDSDNDGNESDANEWWNGRVDPENDSEIDSDEAFGESDEERYDGYKLSESKGKKKTNSKVKSRSLSQLDIGEPSSEDDEEDLDVGDDGADLGEDAVDLATMLDDSFSDLDEESSDSLSDKNSVGSDSADEFEDGDDEEEDSSEDDLPSEVDDDEDMDGNRLAELHDIINSIHPSEKKATAKASREISSLELGASTELGVSASRKLSLNDVLSTVTDKEMKKTLKSLAKKSNASRGPGAVPGKLEAPLPKRKQEELNRAVATKEANKSLDRWVETVKHHRRAEHLSFPIVDPTVGAVQGENTFLPPSSTKPMNDLESTIQNILLESGLATGREKDGDNLRAFDELEEKKMSYEEVMAARAALRKQRDLLFREEVRAKRVKKIKSKSYRRIHRKERERETELEREALVAAGVDLSEEEREKNERRRAEERMGAKHRDSKWAKSMKESGRTVWDDEAKTGVTEMARRNEELRRRIAGKTVHEEESDLGSEFEDEKLGFDSSDDEETRQKAVNQHLDRINQLHTEAETSANSRLASLKFMQKAEAARKAETEAEIAALRSMMNEGGSGDESSEPEHGTSGRMKFGPQKTAVVKKAVVKRNEFEEPEEANSDVEGAQIQACSGHTQNDQISSRSDGPSGAGKSKAEREKDVSSAQSSSSNPWMGTPSTSLQQKSRADAPLESNPWTMPKATKQQAGLNDGVALITNTIPPNADSNADLLASASTVLPQTAGERTKLTLTSSSKKAQKKVSGTTKIADPTGALEMLSDSDSDSDSDNDAPRSDKLQATLQSAISRNQALVQQAFGGADVEAEFEREKQRVIEEEDDQVIDNTLPGWGSWTGSGVSTKPKKGGMKGGKKATNRPNAAVSAQNKGKFTTVIPGVKAQNRKDGKLKNVIINERKVRSNTVYQSDSLPFPFTSREEYERSIRMPIGSEWTSLKSKPRVMVKPGVVIEPLRKPVV